MSDDIEPLFDPDELASMAERARLDAQTGVKGERVPKGVELDDAEVDALRAREHARLHRGLTGLRLAARAYAATRDPKGLRSVVWGAWAIHACRMKVRDDAEDVLAAAVHGVGERVFEVPGLAERLASCEVKAARLALARALPVSARSAPVLHALARDADPDVRAAAAQKVGADDPWGGAFPISPDGHAHAILEEARAVLELRGYEREEAPERAALAFAPLSDALAVACWERVLSAEHVSDGAMRAWTPLLLERPGGGATLARLYALWWRRGDYFSEKQLEEAAKLPPEVRTRALGEVLEALREIDRRASEGEEVEAFLDDQIARAACIIAPDEGDARALLEWILGCPLERAGELASGYHAPSTTLGELLVRWPLDAALREVLIEARRAGTPGRWDRVPHEVWRSLGPDPVLRERARRELEADDPYVREAAVRRLLGEQHEPSDGTVEEVAQGLYARPELRAALVRASAAVRPQARRDLEAGRSSMTEAIAVLSNTPAAEQTDAMWSVARARRDEALAGTDEERARALEAVKVLVRRGDEWDARDLAYAREVMEPAYAFETHGLLGMLLIAIARVDAPESAALLSAIEARATTPEARARLKEARRFAEALS